MKLNIFLKGFVSLFVLLFSSYSWALYPEKEGYQSKGDNFGVYLGVGVGTSVSNTFGIATKENYVSLYAPSRTLSGGTSLLNLGLRLYDFRFEGEYSNFFQWYSVFNDAKYHTAAVNSNTLPTKGQEAINNLAFNVYYDFRFISSDFYPYIGGGVGSSSARYIWIDQVLQPNGLGENFNTQEDLFFYQLMVGLQYDLKIIKSSFSVEYRLMKPSSLIVNPGNDGLHDIGNEETQMPGMEESLYPNAEDWIKPASKEVSPIFHSIIFTFKYYLY